MIYSKLLVRTVSVSAQQRNLSGAFASKVITSLSIGFAAGCEAAASPRRALFLMMRGPAPGAGLTYEKTVLILGEPERAQPKVPHNFFSQMLPPVFF